MIVSHIIVLFDFIEEKHAEGEPLNEALLDAGIMRLASGADHSGRNGDRAVPTGDARWTIVGADVLRADRRFDGSHVHHVAAGAGDLFDLRSRFETGEVGKRRDSANNERCLAGCCASGCWSEVNVMKPG